MERKSIGSFIAALRRANGLTQQELADKLNVSNKAVSRWERDETLPDLTLIPAIAEVFGVTCDEILRGERMTTLPADTEEDDEAAARAELRAAQKSERRAAAIVNRALSNFKMANVIAAAVALTGITVLFLREFLIWTPAMFMVCDIVFPLSIIVSVLITVLSLMKLKDSCGTEIAESCDDATVLRYEKTMVNFSYAALSIVLAILLLIACEQLIFTFFSAPGASFDLTPSIIAVLVLLKPLYAMLLTGRRAEIRRVSKRERIFHITEAALSVLAAALIYISIELDRTPGVDIVSVVLEYASAALVLTVLILAIVYVILCRGDRVRAVLDGVRWVLFSVGAAYLASVRSFAWDSDGDLIFYLSPERFALGVTLIFVTAAVYKVITDIMTSKKKM